MTLTGFAMELRGACIRGLLCIRCNMALGLLKDSPTILRAAIRWLEKKPIRLF